MEFTKRTILGDAAFTISDVWKTAKFPALKLPYETKTYGSSQFSDGSLRIDTESCVVLIDRFDHHAPANATIYPPTASPRRMAIGQIRLTHDQYEDIISFVKGRYVKCVHDTNRFAERFKAFSKRKREVKAQIIHIVDQAERFVVAQAKAEAERLEETKRMF